MKIISIKKIKNWASKKEMLEFCDHIISHQERYSKERVFEAKELSNYS